MVWLGILLIVLAFVIFVNATEKVKYGEYDHPSLPLATFGIYQWGQGLVLAAFWILYGLACIFWWTPAQAIQAYVLFHMIRAVVELTLIIGGKYQGLAEAIAPHSRKLTSEQRLQLYGICQGMIVLSGLLIIIK